MVIVLTYMTKYMSFLIYMNYSKPLHRRSQTVHMGLLSKQRNLIIEVGFITVKIVSVILADLI